MSACLEISSFRTFSHSSSVRSAPLVLTLYRYLLSSWRVTSCSTSSLALPFFHRFDRFDSPSSCAPLPHASHLPSTPEMQPHTSQMESATSLAAGCTSCNRSLYTALSTASSSDFSPPTPKPPPKPSNPVKKSSRCIMLDACILRVWGLEMWFLCTSSCMKSSPSEFPCALCIVYTDATLLRWVSRGEDRETPQAMHVKASSVIIPHWLHLNSRGGLWGRVWSEALAAALLCMLRSSWKVAEESTSTSPSLPLDITSSNSGVAALGGGGAGALVLAHRLFFAFLAPSGGSRGSRPLLQSQNSLHTCTCDLDPPHISVAEPHISFSDQPSPFALNMSSIKLTAPITPSLTSYLALRIGSERVS
mmetsp:Transcript_13562/g.33239  ORF Transcript_13562/g.33239 Transcript_13562/m.33239 type:complete len:362 (+) Transcript_13562:1157-2242(+)